MNFCCDFVFVLWLKLTPALMLALMHFDYERGQILPQNPEKRPGAMVVRSPKIMYKSLISVVYLMEPGVVLGASKNGQKVI